MKWLRGSKRRQRAGGTRKHLWQNMQPLGSSIWWELLGKVLVFGLYIAAVIGLVCLGVYQWFRRRAR